MKKQPIVYLQTVGQPLTPEQEREMIFTLNPEQKKALRQVLDRSFAVAATDVSDPDAPDHVRAHAGGRLEAISLLRDQLERLWNGMVANPARVK